MRVMFGAVVLTAAMAAALPVRAQPGPGATVDWRGVSERIAWFGTWRGALAAAEASGRPILLVSAAPHCRNISGVW